MNYRDLQLQTCVRLISTQISSCCSSLQMPDTARNIQPPDQHQSAQIDEHEQEASELYQLARSLLLECKESQPVSTLESAIFLLRDMLDKQPRPHPFRLTTLYHLSLALITRCSHFGWHNDVEDICHYLAEHTTVNIVILLW